MVINKILNLSKTSIERMDALNSIKYTLLLDYQIPEWKEDADYIPELMHQCGNCCCGLFTENISSSIQFDFFGRFFSTNDSLFNYFYSYTAPSGSKTIPSGIPGLILQHCIFSSYHAILSELLSNTTITSYTVANKIKKNGLYSLYQNHNLKFSDNGIDFQKKSSDPKQKTSTRATDLQNKTSSHKVNLSEVFSLLASDESKAYRYSLQFSNIAYTLFNINTSTFRVGDTNSKDALIFLKNAVDKLEPSISSLKIPEKAFSSYGRTPIDGLYFYYLMERLSNVRLTYSLLRQIQATEFKSPFHLSNNPTLDILSLCSKLPNVFSRQYFIKYALEAFAVKPQSYIDFWTHQSLERSSAMGYSMRGTPAGFQFPKWLEQYSLFINYMAEFVIPIFEWCFLNMLLDSVEAKYPEEPHHFHLELIFKKLASYVNDNYLSILYPIKLENEKEVVDIMAPIKNWNILENLSPEVIHYLKNKLFFLAADKTGSMNRIDLNLNLPNISPAYFKTPTQTSPNSNASRVRKFYLDLIKITYLQPKD